MKKTLLVLMIVAFSLTIPASPAPAQSDCDRIWESCIMAAWESHRSCILAGRPSCDAIYFIWMDICVMLAEHCEAE